MNKKLISAAISLALVSVTQVCSGSDIQTSNVKPLATAAWVQPPLLNPVEKNFNRVAVFPVCSQVGSSCEGVVDATPAGSEGGDAPTAAEIVTVSNDGATLIYSNSP